MNVMDSLDEKNNNKQTYLSLVAIAARMHTMAPITTQNAKIISQAVEGRKW